MIVKNTSGKIIGFGQTVLLPGQEAEIADNFGGNTVVATYKNLGFIEVVKAEAPAEKKTKNTGKKSSATEEKSE